MNMYLKKGKIHLESSYCYMLDRYKIRNSGELVRYKIRKDQFLERNMKGDNFTLELLI